MTSIRVISEAKEMMITSFDLISLKKIISLIDDDSMQYLHVDLRNGGSITYKVSDLPKVIYNFRKVEIIRYE